jgi:hypothetical protein
MFMLYQETNIKNNPQKFEEILLRYYPKENCASSLKIHFYVITAEGLKIKTKICIG